MEGLGGLALIIIVMYFAPSVIGMFRKHHNLVALIALNVLLGWTLLGWVAAFVWSLTKPPKAI